MDQQSQESPDQSTNANLDNLVSQLTVYVDQEGNIAYNCDWEPSEDGLLGIGTILYKLISDDLPNKIFDEIRDQCVLNDAEADFMAIQAIISKYRDIKKGEDSIVVPPDKIVNL
jgi:hypothetical protein